LEDVVIEVAPEKTRTVAAEAFLFGYPLALMDLTRAVLTHVVQPAAGAEAPVSGEGPSVLRSMEAVACSFPRKEHHRVSCSCPGALR
jgi:hypothetical protein